jgi:hypothetical protein
MNKYFGPLPREYCVYFYAFSVVFGVLFVSSIFSTAYFMFTHMKKINTMFVINSIFILSNIFFVYLQNRLLHTMCVKSI